MAYAVIKTGGKQYRVEEARPSSFERLKGDEGSKLELEPLLYADGDKSILGGSDSARSRSRPRWSATSAAQAAHLQVQAKRGYKRRTGHRQELTRIEVTGIKVSGSRSKAKKDEEA